MNKTRYFLFAIFVLITGFFSGPKVDQSFYPKKFAIPESVEEYIKKSESVLTDIRPNNEKKIIWFDESKKQKTKVSIVYLHGYGASRNEIAPICDLLAKEFKANLFYTRLAGHGRSFDAMGEPSVSDWLNDSIEAIEIGEKIGEKVILVGTSTGATLGIWLLAETEKKNSIQASIFLSPNFWPYDKSSKVATFPWGKQIVSLALGDYRAWVPRSKEVEMNWTYKTPTKAVVTLMGLVDLVSKIDVSKIQTPMLFLYSTKDNVIDPILVEKKFAQLGSPKKKIIAIDNSEDVNNHVLAGNIISPKTNEVVLSSISNFLKEILKN